MPRKSLELKLANDTITVMSEALPYEEAEDLLPEVGSLIASVIDRAAPMFAAGEIRGLDDVGKLLPALGGLTTALGGGKLRALAPRILAGTSVTAGPRDKRVKYDLVKKDERADCFDEYPEHYFAILFHAGRVTFGPFLPVAGLVKAALAKAAAAKAKAAAAKQE